MDSAKLTSMITRRAALLLAAVPRLFGQRSDPRKGCPVIHFEIGCKDRARTGEFFAKLFDWQIQVDSPGGDINTGSPEGIAGHITALGHEPQHYTTFYVAVDDVQAYLDKATALGGKKLVGPINFPGGTFGWFSDPEGNMIGLLKRKA